MRVFKAILASFYRVSVCIISDYITERRTVKKKTRLNRLYDKLHDFIVTTMLLY